MHNLPEELYHSQVVGKMSFIVRVLQLIDPKGSLQTIRKDYAREIQCITDAEKALQQLTENDCKNENCQAELNKFTILEQQSKAGKCPSLDTLSQNAWIIQELSRLITLIQPFSLDEEMIEEAYLKMKNQPDLWSSLYHHQLNDLEQLTNSLDDIPLPNQVFFNAILCKLKYHLSTNGLADNDTISTELFKLAKNMQESVYKKTNKVIPLFIAYLESQQYLLPFAGALSKEDETKVIVELIAAFAKKIKNATLNSQLNNLRATICLNKSLLDSISSILTKDHALHDLRSMRLDTHFLKAEEIDELFKKAIRVSRKNDVELTKNLCKLALLSKAFPKAKELINKDIENIYPEMTAQLFTSPNFIMGIIQQVIEGQTPIQNGIEQETTNQLITQCYWYLNEPTHIPESMELKDLYAFINARIQNINEQTELRKNQLQQLGYGFPSFENVENIVNSLDPQTDENIKNIITDFYTAIKEAKELQFYQRKNSASPKQQFYQPKNSASPKQLEEITAKEFHAFFEACCAAGKNAAQRLENNRTGLELIMDVLKSIANWTIRLLSGGTTPQFFKKPKTAVDDLVQAVNELRKTLEKTLQHIDFSEESQHNITA
ncbi:hypothetical protein [Legionella worsleiensis]|uniref:Uncharacterized protein n=1 Tax=Legionella worsleiensis TaxID=45076 RepID=A0A0W1A941_9GAMM|nr:hypothetical protein [Legionella worsleiensis]KTD77877.1 hypothetical protein Lwor_1759 [Legionella worsleiensis]STY33122.1 Uncharacterised protein [Legionella worsleiensis]